VTSTGALGRFSYIFISWRLYAKAHSIASPRNTDCPDFSRSIRPDVRSFYESQGVDLREIRYTICASSLCQVTSDHCVCASDQDTTDLDKCLAIAASQSCSSCIHVCTSLSGRFDHVLSSVSSCVRNQDRRIVLRAQGNTAGNTSALRFHTRNHPLRLMRFEQSFYPPPAAICPSNSLAATHSCI
jgi:hypothetical protein